MPIVGFFSEQLWIVDKIIAYILFGRHLMNGKGYMANTLIRIVHLYQEHISYLFAGSCIYTPSCSEYSIEVIQKNGAFLGTYLTFRRLLRCRPPYEGGHDPVR